MHPKSLRFDAHGLKKLLSLSESSLEGLQRRRSTDLSTGRTKDVEGGAAVVEDTRACAAVTVAP